MVAANVGTSFRLSFGIEGSTRVTSILERAEPYYDPYDYEVDANAQAVWKRLRDEAPLYWNDKYEFFALSRFDDVLPRDARHHHVQLGAHDRARDDGPGEAVRRNDDLHGPARAHATSGSS